jgi:hypothetical protein
MEFEEIAIKEDKEIKIIAEVNPIDIQVKEDEIKDENYLDLDNIREVVLESLKSDTELKNEERDPVVEDMIREYLNYYDMNDTLSILEVFFFIFSFNKFIRFCLKDELQNNLELLPDVEENISLEVKFEQLFNINKKLMKGIKQKNELYEFELFFI